MTEPPRYWILMRQATRLMALIGFLGLLLLAVMTTVDILSRWLFNAPIYGVNDISAIMMAVVIHRCAKRPRRCTGSAPTTSAGDGLRDALNPREN